MGKIGTTELLVVLAIVLVIFGPKALPKLGRSLGKTLGSFRKGMSYGADDDEDDEDEDDYEDYDDEDEDDAEDDEYDFGDDEVLYEVKCPTCGEEITIDEQMLDEGSGLPELRRRAGIRSGRGRGRAEGLTHPEEIRNTTKKRYDRPVIPFFTDRRILCGKFRSGGSTVISKVITIL